MRFLVHTFQINTINNSKEQKHCSKCLVYTSQINVINNIKFIFTFILCPVHTFQIDVTNNNFSISIVDKYLYIHFKSMLLTTFIFCINKQTSLYIHLKTMLLTTGYLKLIDIQLIIFEMLQITCLKFP